MKCDDFLQFLATGGFWRRLHARLHAVFCSQCAETSRFHRRMRRTLSHSPPLTAEQRRLWEQAAVTGRQTPETLSGIPRRKRNLLKFATAASLLIAISMGGWYATGLWRSSHSTDSLTELESPKPHPPEKLIVVTQDAPQQETRDRISQIEADLKRLLDELDDLSRHVDLLDERREIEELLTESDETSIPVPSIGEVPHATLPATTPVSLVEGTNNSSSDVPAGDVAGFPAVGR